MISTFNPECCRSAAAFSANVGYCINRSARKDFPKIITMKKETNIKKHITQKFDIKIEGKRLNQTNKVKYLGVIIT